MNLVLYYLLNYKNNKNILQTTKTYWNIVIVAMQAGKTKYLPEKHVNF